MFYAWDRCDYSHDQCGEMLSTEQDVPHTPPNPDTGGPSDGGYSEYHDTQVLAVVNEGSRVIAQSNSRRYISSHSSSELISQPVRHSYSVSSHSNSPVKPPCIALFSSWRLPHLS